jgi:hypothetical protein
MQQVDMLRSMHQTTQQQLTHAQQMLHEMQHRYDRLLEAPRSTAPPSRPELGTRPRPGTVASPRDPRGDIRWRIVALLRGHPEGLTPAEMRTLLDVDRSLADTCLGMLRYGLGVCSGYVFMSDRT